MHRVFVLGTDTHGLLELFVAASMARALASPLRALLLWVKERGEHPHSGHHEWHWIKWRLQPVETKGLVPIRVPLLVLMTTIAFSIGLLFSLFIFLIIFILNLLVT